MLCLHVLEIYFQIFWSFHFCFGFFSIYYLLDSFHINTKYNVKMWLFFPIVLGYNNCKVVVSQSAIKLQASYCASMLQVLPNCVSSSSPCRNTAGYLLYEIVNCYAGYIMFTYVDLLIQLTQPPLVILSTFTLKHFVKSFGLRYNTKTNVLT